MFLLSEPAVRVNLLDIFSSENENTAVILGVNLFFTAVLVLLDEVEPS